MSDEYVEELTNYQKFRSALELCLGMANEYLHRCVIDGRVNTDDLYYFRNLMALSINNESNLPEIICSNTDPNCTNESTKYSNIRFISIDETLFNKSSEEFDKSHLDQALLQMVKIMNSDQKLQLYNALRDMIGDNLMDEGGL